MPSEFSWRWNRVIWSFLSKKEVIGKGKARKENNKISSNIEGNIVSANNNRKKLCTFTSLINFSIS